MSDKFQTHKIDTKFNHQGILHKLQNINFRQSFLQDYKTCKQMSLYNHILGLEQQQQFVAAFLGSVGHQIIYEMHDSKKFIDKQETQERIFCETYNDLLNQRQSEGTPPPLGPKYPSYEEQRDTFKTIYAEMLCGYARNKYNREFNSTLHEQEFTLPINTIQSEQENNPFIFTGTIDQAGYYDDGTFALRDIKFRDNAFKPFKMQLLLDYQLTIYSYALKFGYPSCEKCRPKLDNETQILIYNGPCKSCTDKIDTPYWPRLYAERCEIIWMQDYLTYKRDEYAKFIKDPHKIKERGPSGRMRIRNIKNPKWSGGYKKGEQKGFGALKTTRTPRQLESLMVDIMFMCQQVRNGVFYREPSDICNNWCKHSETCYQHLLLEQDEDEMLPVISDDPEF